MRIGRFGRCPGGELLWAFYLETGELSIRVLADPERQHLGEIEATLTVNPPLGAPLAGEDEAWIRTWGGNEAAVTAMIAAGIADPTGLHARCGYEVAVLCRLTPAAIADKDAAFEKNPDMRVARDQAIAKRKAAARG